MNDHNYKVEEISLNFNILLFAGMAIHPVLTTGDTDRGLSGADLPYSEGGIICFFVDPRIIGMVAVMAGCSHKGACLITAKKV
ncbi:MAG: hypothetical protein U9R17_17675 [Thermodesulfobacteriota bacterium]|nr:hypothetical protein [Thermodesulfobacteriota bacterium]